MEREVSRYWQPSIDFVWGVAVAMMVVSLVIMLWPGVSIVGPISEPVAVNVGDCFVLDKDLESWEEKAIVKVDIIGKKKYHYVFWHEVYGWMDDPGAGTDRDKDVFSEIWKPTDCPDGKPTSKETTT